MPRHSRLGLLAMAAIAGAATVFAQPERPADRGPDGPPGRAIERTPGQRGEFSREVLQRRLQERREEVARLEAMLRRIDAGDAPTREGGPDRVRDEPEQDDPGPVGGPQRQIPRERVMAFLREHHPEFARHLEELREHRPDLADRALMDLTPRLRELGELREKDPPLFAMKLEGTMLDWQMRRTVFETVRDSRAKGDGAPPDAGALRARLAPMVERRFHLSLRERTHSVGTLEQRMTTLRDEIATDEANAPRIIEERLDRLMEHVDRMTREAPRFEGRGPRPDRPMRPGQKGPAEGEPARPPSDNHSPDMP